MGGEPPVIESADLEYEFVLAVNKAVSKLLVPIKKFNPHPSAGNNGARKVKVNPRFEDWLLIVRLYGLFNGILHTMDEVGQMFEFGGEGYKQLM